MIVTMAQHLLCVDAGRYFNMPDMLSVGQGRQTQAQYRAQMLLWSVMGAPLILGADIRKMDAFTKSLVTAPEVRTAPS